MPTSPHLKQLESESIYIIREVASQFQRPTVLYSVGKDSSVLLRLIEKAFYPASIPFPLLHVDTGYKFDEMYEFRDSYSKSIGAKLIVHRNESAIDNGTNPFTLGTQACCGHLKTQALLNALKEGGFDAALGGARRDEEKSRAKERIFSFRDSFGQWEPRKQRPELWSLYNGRVNQGESIRVFPLSNWTELDVWEYIESENIPIVPLYFAKKRPMIVRGEQLIPVHASSRIRSDEKPTEIMCRYRTLGCIPCTGAVRSTASTVSEIRNEIREIRISERSTRIIDHDGEASMETKKREGYF